jgi:DNA gyrase subunit A
MDLGQVKKVNIDKEMQQSYLDYAMSVIVARALPDARDGLKPVQRRILYAMHEIGLSPASDYKKSARIVGEVLGKFHPHGDTSVYEAMARMAQDFSMRCMLVDGQGNFGSVDGDPPAAMRYTEARLTAASIELLKDLDKNTVHFSGNFDETLKEPDVLPAAFPNLLVNGATGIAVGMATNIPPHNLTEVVSALQFMLTQWDKLDDITVEVLMHYIKGPDFPTGGVIIQEADGENLMSIYGSGKGKVIIQARAHLEEMERGKNRIIVTELPYMANKSAVIERIAELVRSGDMEGIVDLRDESDRQGMRIVIELSKTTDPEAILRDLYKRTPMQSTLGINLLALVNGGPHLLTLKQALKVYLDHRLTVIHHRTAFDLDKAKQRAHILEGLRIAIANLDEIITIIRGSQDTDQARQRLMKRFKLSEIQTQAILDMPLKRLAALERKKIEEEFKQVMALIKELEALLASPKLMRQMVIDELQTIRDTYGDARRTQILELKEGVSKTSMLTITDVTPMQDVWVMINEEGMVVRTRDGQNPSAAGKDAPLWLLKTNSHQTIYLATCQGNAAAIPVHSIPEGEKPSDGAAYTKLAPLSEEEPLGAVFTLPPKNEWKSEMYILTVTRGGLLKKSAISELPGPSAHAFVLCKVNEGDSLAWALLTSGKNELVLATSKGMCIRFSEEDIRPMGLAAAGVGGVKLGVGDEVIGASLVDEAGEVVLIASDGFGKRVKLADFPVQSRYGQGVIAWKISASVRLAGFIIDKPSTWFIGHFEKSASKKSKFGDVPLMGRPARGKQVFELRPGEVVLGVTSPWDGNLNWTGGYPAEGGSAGSEKKPRKKPAAAAPVKTRKGKATPTADPKSTRTKAAKKDGAPGKKPAKATPVEGKKAPVKKK